jgi:hypothetical protein
MALAAGLDLFFANCRWHRLIESAYRLIGPAAEGQHCIGCDDSQAKLQGSKLEKSGKQLANNIIAHLDHHYVRVAGS